jgi:hypothetical protein
LNPARRRGRRGDDEFGLELATFGKRKHRICPERPPGERPEERGFSATVGANQAGESIQGAVERAEDAEILDVQPGQHLPPAYYGPALPSITADELDSPG